MMKRFVNLVFGDNSLTPNHHESYARELHSDSIEIEGSEEISKVKFIPFMGISPLRYRDFFEKGRRKDKATGKVIRWAGGTIGVPIVEIYHPVYIELETIVSSELKRDKRLSEKPPLPSDGETTVEKTL